MSLTSFLFGNVDDSGKLDIDLDDDLRETLSNVDTNVISKIFNADPFELDQTIQSDNNDDEMSSIVPTMHSKDALDYTDFNETVPDDIMCLNQSYRRRSISVTLDNVVVSRESVVGDECNQDKDEAIIHVHKEEEKGDGSRTADIKELFPAFEKDKILQFSELFKMTFKKPSKLQAHKRIIFDDGYEYEMEEDDRLLFMKDSKTQTSNWLDKDDLTDSDESDDDIDEMNRNSNIGMIEDEKCYHSVMLDEWENDIIWDDDKDENISFDSSDGYNPEISVNKYVNEQLEEGDWLNDIIWDKERPASSSTMKILFDLNDPNMMFEQTVEPAKELLTTENTKEKEKRVGRPLKAKWILNETQTEIDPYDTSTPLDRFNLSNDKHYQSLHLTGRRVRQTLGPWVVKHSIPALKLHPALYKIKLSKSELRSFHRPRVQFPLNTDIHFSPMKESTDKTKKKNKKNKNKEKKKKNMNSILSTQDLTLSDTASFVLFEFSEENPPIMSSIGMGTLIIHYYRKTDPEDPFIPNLDMGEPCVLDVNDISPFMNFGQVEPGQTISVLYNNLIRAPLFHHHQATHTTDFLLLKNTYKGQVRYYLCEIPPSALFTVGQTLPVEPVPDPRSRKITTTVKNRFQVVAYRLLKRDPLRRLTSAHIASLYLDYSNIQIRLRLKEFLKFYRLGYNTSYWEAHDELPTEETLLKMVTPEMVCLYESMLVGERYLLDLGYFNTSDASNDSELELEQQLAPWFTTRHFVDATQGKAMLQLYGAGDPTGRGEGFSFLRASMKDFFLREGESVQERLAQMETRPKSARRLIVAEQQQVYKEEISRIWKAQLDSLSNPVEPILSDNENSPSNSEMDYDHGTSPTVAVDPSSQLESVVSNDSDDISMIESTSSNDHVNHHNYYLIIKRRVKQSNGEYVWQQEIIYDPIVIKSYVKQRQMIDEASVSVEALEPTDDKEKNARMKKRIQDQLTKLKRSAERRRQCQSTKQTALAENPILETTTKQSGSDCGQLGYVKTYFSNKK